MDQAFYTVSDRRYFLGTVALLNSLRLLGHSDPVFLVDAGLSDEQRDLIAGHVTLIPAPKAVPAFFLKVLGPLSYPADVAMLLDADVIVVRPLDELIDAARTGRMVAFINNEPNHDRFFADWAQMLGLGPLQRRAYLANGQLWIPRSMNTRVLQPWRDAQHKVDIRRTCLGRGTLMDPFYFPDMDVFNAIVSAHLEPDEVLAYEHRLAPHPPFAELALIDKRRLVCRYPDGTQPFLLHHILDKPWLKPTRANAYSRLLPRLLLAPDVSLRLEPELLPVRLREGWLAAGSRVRANAQATVFSETRRQVGRLEIRTRLRARRARRDRS
jgi:hypothetical protein